MGVIRIYDRVGSVCGEEDYRRLEGAVGGSERTRTGKDGQSEPVLKPNDGLHNVTTGSRFNPVEH